MVFLLASRGGPGSRCRRLSWAVQLPRNQALAAELRPRLLERDVGGRKDQIGWAEIVTADRGALAHQVEQPGESRPETLILAGLTGGDGLVVQLVERVQLSVAELIL